MTAAFETARSWSRGLIALALVTCMSPAMAQEFPLTIEHKFGTTVIQEKPERVASVDYGGIGNLLALGVQPVTVREWRKQDGFALTAGPWAAPFLTTEPRVLEGELDFEAVADTRPDVIIALWSGIDAGEYEKLSLIAPVVPVPEGVGDYALSWEDRAMIAGRAVGKEAEAARRIKGIKDRLASIRQEHPAWEELSAVVGSVTEGSVNIYNRYDVRAQFMASLGFKTPEALDAVTDDTTFHIGFSPEDIGPYDADVFVWYGDSNGMQDARDFPARPFLKAHRTGGEVFVPDTVLAALARLSLLSIPVAIDALVPMLEAAADGDPATKVPDARQ